MRWGPFVSIPGRLARDVAFPLVRAMAAVGAHIRVPAAVVCRVLAPPPRDTTIRQVVQGPGLSVELRRRARHRRDP